MMLVGADIIVVGGFGSQTADTKAWMGLGEI